MSPPGKYTSAGGETQPADGERRDDEVNGQDQNEGPQPVDQQLYAKVAEGDALAAAAEALRREPLQEEAREDVDPSEAARQLGGEQHAIDAAQPGAVQRDEADRRRRAAQPRRELLRDVDAGVQEQPGRYDGEKDQQPDRERNGDVAAALALPLSLVEVEVAPFGGPVVLLVAHRAQGARVARRAVHIVAGERGAFAQLPPSAGGWRDTRGHVAAGMQRVATADVHAPGRVPPVVWEQRERLDRHAGDAPVHIDALQRRAEDALARQPSEVAGGADAARGVCRPNLGRRRARPAAARAWQVALLVRVRAQPAADARRLSPAVSERAHA
eukprot:scaffold13341_cov101-Isochrysis_galbana.AAC.2